MTNEQKKAYEIAKWKWAVQHMARLIELDAPNCIKAHALFSIIVPRLIRMMNIAKEAGDEIAGMLTAGLGFKSGMCCICKKVPLYPDSKDDYCPKCLAESDQWGKEFEPNKEEKLLDAIFNFNPDEEESEGTGNAD